MALWEVTNSEILQIITATVFYKKENAPDIKSNLLLILFPMAPQYSKKDPSAGTNSILPIGEYMP